MLGELLAVVTIMICCTILTLPQISIDDSPWQAKQLQSELILLQTTAMYQKEKQSYTNISFNEWGHINRGQTINLNEQQLVLFLGMGRSEIRQRNVVD